jgi:hypothetical protein
MELQTKHHQVVMHYLNGKTQKESYAEVYGEDSSTCTHNIFGREDVKAFLSEFQQEVTESTKAKMLSGVSMIVDKAMEDIEESYFENPSIETITKSLLTLSTTMKQLGLVSDKQEIKHTSSMGKEEALGLLHQTIFGDTNNANNGATKA